MTKRIIQGFTIEVFTNGTFKIHIDKSTSDVSQSFNTALESAAKGAASGAKP